MAEKILGLDFDIHGGGLDLVFPHHENEIAQTEAGRGRPLARIWMHNGMIRFGEEKMAKSVGNIRTLADALDEHGRDALIMYFLAGHYRQPLAFSDEALEQARALARAGARTSAGWSSAPGDAADGEPAPEVAARLRDAFFAALRDDFNTPRGAGGAVRAGRARATAGSRRERRFPGVAAALARDARPCSASRTCCERTRSRPTRRRCGSREEREQARRRARLRARGRVRRQLAERGYEVRDTADGPVLVRTPRAA